ncbi:hypothetical protein [Bradyrhizobium sp. McL0616]|uniref:hypothetical protein n=1 Tax=Bradyrhizobium sp. McL0616 TaxID=3415674 RepID=UPI003CEDD220
MYAFNPLLFTVYSLALPAACCLGLAAGFAAFLRLSSGAPSYWKILTYYFFFTLPVSLIAFLAGNLTGLSRSSAIGSVLPAVLALLAGLMVYVFGSDNRFKIVVGYSAFIFVVTLFLGVQVGAYKREAEREAYLRYLSEQEFRIRVFRKNLGLPDEMPAWITGLDSK